MANVSASEHVVLLEFILYGGHILKAGRVVNLIGEIKDLKKEIAAMSGDYNFGAFEKLVDFSIPATEQEGKDVMTSA